MQHLVAHVCNAAGRSVTVAPLAGVLLEDVEKNALPADENMGDAKSVPAAQDALSAASPDACTEEAVSYTHLDVYKRQHRRDAGRYDSVRFF